jgi:hypothetical protein
LINVGRKDHLQIALHESIGIPQRFVEIALKKKQFCTWGIVTMDGEGAQEPP